MPCSQGTRANIDESRRRAAEERERDRVNEQAFERIHTKERPTFADFLAEADPIGVLLLFLVSVVFRDGDFENVEALSPSARAVYFFNMLHGEVINGGFEQYFSNSSGEFAHEALAVLQELGAVQAASLLQEAIHAFPEQRVPKDWEERNEQLESVGDGILDAIDTRYYALADSGAEDLEQIILAYMSRHASEPVHAVP